MIGVTDIESIVIDDLNTLIKAQFPTALIRSTEEQRPTSFPFIHIRETDNYAHERTMTAQAKENHTNLTYTVDVYSNAPTGERAQARAVMGIVSKYFRGIGFYRISTRTTPNPLDTNVERLTAMFNAVIDKNNHTFRR